MGAKVQILDKRINSFGGIFFAIDQYRSSGLAALIDNTLSTKGINTKYSHSDVVGNLMSVLVSGGEVLEDVNFFRQEAFKANPDYRFCSAAPRSAPSTCRTTTSAGNTCPSRS